MSRLTSAVALEEAVSEEMRRDDRVFMMSTTVPPGLLKEFGPARVRQAPISESAMTGIAVGSAGSGYRPIVDWRSVTFAFMAFDQVANQASKIRYMFGGQRDFPILFRARYGNGSRSAAQHSQTGYALYAHLAGLKIILPSGPIEEKGLLKSAIRDNNPVVSFEPGRIETIEADVPDGDHVIPLGVASVARPGSDVTVVALGYMVHEALAAAEELMAEGINTEVVDPRTLVPLDVDAIRASVHKTGRLIVVDESPPTCSMASEIAAAVLEDRDTFQSLRGPVVRVCALPVPIPFSPPLEDAVLPGRARIAAAIRAALNA